MDFYRKYARPLLRKCERMLGNADDAEDVVQALFTDMLRKGKTDVDLPYLYRAATSRCLNVLRDSKRRRELLARQGEDLLAPARTRLDEQLVSVDLLTQLIESLDRKSAEILVYRYLDDMTQAEIAALMKTSRKTVGKRLSKIKLTVRKLAENGKAGVA